MGEIADVKPPAGISEFLVQVTGAEREAPWDYAVAHGHGAELFDFSDSELLDEPARLQSLRDWCRARRSELKGRLSLHGAYYNLAPGALDRKIRAATRERIVQCLDLAEELGAHQVVFHCDFDLVPTPEHLAGWVERAAGFWREVIAGRKLEVFLENAFEPEPQIVRALVEAIASPQIGVCLDVGHAHLMSALWARARGKRHWPSPADWLDALGEHVRYLHLSDNDGTGDQHLAAGQGNLDWPALLGRLAGRPSPLPALIEVVGVAGTEETKARLAQEGGGSG